MPSVDEYLAAQSGRFEDELCELLRIPSVSAESKHKQDVRRAGEWVLKQFQSLGLKTEMIETAGHPLVYAESAAVAGSADGAGVWALRCAAARSAWISGFRRRLSRRGGMGICMRGAPRTIRGRC